MQLFKSSTLNLPNIDLMEVQTQRVAVATVLRRTDLFIDLSWWQAFGRSGLEAMACGTLSIMPLTGAASEICGEDDEANCLYHDGNDQEGFYLKTIYYRMMS